MKLPMERHVLSKSTFLRGCQCAKSLYLYKYHFGLRNNISVEQQEIFNRGIDFGVEARNLFPGGYDATAIGYRYLPEAISKTEAWIQNNIPVIYEAAFQFKRVLSVVDILVKGETGWKAYEVKSSGKLTDTHILDASLQYHVIINSGLELESFNLINMNRNKEISETASLAERCIITNITEPVKIRQPEVEAKINELKQIISVKTLPSVAVGEQCSRPYSCDFTAFCNRPEPGLPLFG